MTDSGKFNSHGSSLKEGMKAPSFKGLDERGETISLSDFEGKKLLLYFYPKDQTPTCTQQACNIRDHFSELKKLGIEIVGVSADSQKSHVRFKNKFQLPYSLIADTEMELIKAYDVWGQKQLFGRIYEGIVRTSFLIDENGRILRIFRVVDSKNHVGQIVEELQK